MATVNFRDDPVRAETSTGNADHDVGSELEGEFNCIYHTGGVANIFPFKVLLGEFTMVSQPIRLILVDWFVFHFF